MIYHAKAIRDDKWWMIEIPEINGTTQARRLGEAELMAREYIATAVDKSLEDVHVMMTFEVVEGIDVEAALAEIAKGRETAAELEAQARQKAEDLAKRLAAEKIPVRDIGTLLGVSFQRAHQLATAGSARRVSSDQ